MLQQDLFSPGSPGKQLWNQGLVSRLLANGSLPARITGLLAMIETLKAMKCCLLRAQGQDGVKVPRQSLHLGRTGIHMDER